MKQFNKNIEEKKLSIKQNKNTYIKRLSISLSCLILVCVIILFTFAKFETSSEEYTLINGLIKNNSCDYDIGQTWLFDYTGSVQNFNALCDGKYKVELWGAQGGTAYSGYPGGAGGYTSGNITLNKNDILYVYVGQVGKGYSSSVSAWNGGGYGGYSAKYSYYGASGGGATDIRYFGSSAPSSSDLEWNSSIGLNSRIMSAGAGGGSGYEPPSAWRANGGAGGGLIGNIPTSMGSSSASHNGKGGTQISGGTSNKYPGSFGIGGNSYHTEAGAGGGGGYYGGGGTSNTSGGGGGSSFISGHTGCVAIKEGSTIEPRELNKNDCITGTTDSECSIHYSGLYFTNTKMIDGLGYEWTTTKASSSTGMPTHDGTSTMTGNTGNGYAKITLLSEN